MIDIEVSEILLDRSIACRRIVEEADKHTEKHGQAEGIITIMIAVEYASKRFGLTPKQLTDSLRSVRKMVKNAQKFTGEDATVAEVVVEIGLN